MEENGVFSSRCCISCGAEMVNRLHYFPYLVTIHRVIHTINAIKSVHKLLNKRSKTEGLLAN
ncbi:putative transposase (partial), partial [Erwinia amylovora ATCC 49946]